MLILQGGPWTPACAGAINHEATAKPTIDATQALSNGETKPARAILFSATDCG